MKDQVIQKLSNRILCLFLVSITDHCDEMRKDADKFLSNQGWIVDGPTDSGLMYCYNENTIKEPLPSRQLHVQS